MHNRGEINTQHFRFVFVLLIGLLFLLPSQAPRAESPIDPALAAEIFKIKAFDNHAHPLRVVSEGEMDTEWDALVSEEPLPEFPLPVGIRPDNPRNISAWRALYGYKYKDMSQSAA